MSAQQGLNSVKQAFRVWRGQDVTARLGRVYAAWSAAGLPDTLGESTGRVQQARASSLRENQLAARRQWLANEPVRGINVSKATSATQNLLAGARPQPRICVYGLTIS